MNEGKTLGAEELYEKVWNQSMNGDNRALQIRISALRSKLDDSGFEIVGVYGKGYRLKQCRRFRDISDFLLTFPSNYDTMKLYAQKVIKEEK